MVEKLRIPVTRLVCVAILGLILLSNSAWDGAGHTASGLMFSAGIFLVGVASLGRLWCTLYIAGYKTENLVTDGPYSISRNPLYFFSLIGAVGIGLGTETLTITAIILLSFAIYYPFVILSEEKRLMAIHNADFTSYMARTPRFFPRLSALREPQTYTVRPVLFRKHAMSALWFVWVMGLLELVEILHRTSILPVLTKIY